MANLCSASNNFIQNSEAKVILLFSVNSSGYFCGVAEMISQVDENKMTGYWTQEKWVGEFKVKWHHVSLLLCYYLLYL